MSVSIFVNVEKLIWLAVINAVKAEAQVLGVVQGFSWSLVCLVVKFVHCGVVEGIKGVGAQAWSCLVYLLPVSKDFIHEGVMEPEDWVKGGNCNDTHCAPEPSVDAAMGYVKEITEISKRWLFFDGFDVHGKVGKMGALDPQCLINPLRKVLVTLLAV